MGRISFHIHDVCMPDYYQGHGHHEDEMTFAIGAHASHKRSVKRFIADVMMDLSNGEWPEAFEGVEDAEVIRAIRESISPADNKALYRHIEWPRGQRQADAFDVMVYGHIEIEAPEDSDK